MIEITVNRTIPPTPYGIFFLTSILAGFFFLFLWLVKREVPKNIILYSMLLNVSLMLYGAKMLTVITSGGAQNLLNAGFSSLGGVIGILVGIWIFQKIYGKQKETFWTAYIVALPLMYGISKMGCFFSGCCYGIPYEGVGCVHYTNLKEITGSVFPVQLVESVAFFALFLSTLVVAKRVSQKTLTVTVLLLGIILKFLLDYLRDSHASKIISVNQGICLGMLLILGAVLVIEKKYEKN
ncbi:MAG: prolipoprotein diacylglyceryl transferase family protein [Roseburia sp.]